MPCLQSGIPALEALHMAWKNHSTNVKYELFSHGLDKAIEKVEEYYEKTGTSDAYTFVMGESFLPSFFVMPVLYLISLIVLDPDTKMSHFKKHWSQSLQDKVLESTENIVCLFCL